MSPFYFNVEGYRDSSGKIRHRYLFSLGRLEDFLETASFKKLARRALSGSIERQPDLKKISEGRLLYYGHCLIKKLWDRFNFDEFFSVIAKDKKFNLAQAVLYMTVRHMMLSDSKLGMYDTRGQFLGFETNGQSSKGII